MKKGLCALLIAATIWGVSDKVEAMCCLYESGYFSWCHLELGVEPILERPNTCDLGYAIIDDRTFADFNAIFTSFDQSFPQGQRKSIEPDFQVGIRAFASLVSRNCYDLRLAYAGLQSVDKVTTRPKNGRGLWPTFAVPNGVTMVLFDGDPALGPAGQLPAVAKAKSRFRWNAGELQVGKRSFSDCRLCTRGFVGLHYANIRNTFIAGYTGTYLPGTTEARAVELFSKRKTRFWAIGPKLGLELDYSVWCGFGIGGRFGAALIGGVGKSNQFERYSDLDLTTGIYAYNPSYPLKVRDMHRAAIVPELDGRLGINYTVCRNRCFGLVFEGGYEFTSYITGLNTQIVTGNRATGDEVCKGFTIDGFYFSVTLSL